MTTASGGHGGVTGTSPARASSSSRAAVDACRWDGPRSAASHRRRSSGEHTYGTAGQRRRWASANPSTGRASTNAAIIAAARRRRASTTASQARATAAMAPSEPPTAATVEASRTPTAWCTGSGSGAQAAITAMNEA